MRHFVACFMILAFASMGFAQNCYGTSGAVPAEALVLRDPVSYALRQSAVVFRAPVVFREPRVIRELRAPIIHRGVNVNVGRITVGRTFIR